jgi:hypothetical protein
MPAGIKHGWPHPLRSIVMLLPENGKPAGSMEQAIHPRHEDGQKRQLVCGKNAFGFFMVNGRFFQFVHRRFFPCVSFDLRFHQDAKR